MASTMREMAQQMKEAEGKKEPGDSAAEDKAEMACPECGCKLKLAKA